MNDPNLYIRYSMVLLNFQGKPYFGTFQNNFTMNAIFVTTY